jgi:hypothetical protein
VHKRFFGKIGVKRQLTDRLPSLGNAKYGLWNKETKNMKIKNVAFKTLRNNRETKKSKQTTLHSKMEK